MGTPYSSLKTNEDASSFSHVPVVAVTDNDKEPLSGTEGKLQHTNKFQVEDTIVSEWIQVAGHKDVFRPGLLPGTVFKNYSQIEASAYEKLMSDKLKDFTPAYYGIFATKEDPKCITLQNVLCQFRDPWILDCKMGTKTSIGLSPNMREDLSGKVFRADMCSLRDLDALLDGITKERYNLTWRDSNTASELVGFRIEGSRMKGEECIKDFRTVDSWEKVKDRFQQFMNVNPGVRVKYLKRLSALREVLPTSEFFCTFELIGTSLLFVHDENSADIWLVDFGQTFPISNYGASSSKMSILSSNHAGNGFIFGVKHLIELLENVGTDSN